VPRIIEVAFKDGYGRAIVELNKSVYFNDKPTLSPIIREALQALYLCVCENQYCTVMHTRGLITLGFSLDDVKNLIENKSLPKSVPEHMRWESIIRVVPVIANEASVSSKLFDFIRGLCSPEEAREVEATIAFAALHRFLLEAYSDEIQIEEEPILVKTIDCADALIQFINQHAKRNSPIITICSLCKDIKTNEGEWIPIESVIEKLREVPKFSHGVCDSCIPRWRAYAGLEH
jgi:hypothetical protein